MNKPADIIEQVSGPLPMKKAMGALKKMVLDHTATVGSVSAPYLRTFSIAVAPTAPLFWLYQQTLYPKFFWSNRDKDDLAAGIGMADVIEYDKTGPNSVSFDILQREISKKDPDTRYFGGFCFNNEQKQDEHWRAFKSFTFVLPEIQLTVKDGVHTLSCHLMVEPGNNAEVRSHQLLEAIDRVKAAAPPDTTGLPGIKSLTFSPDQKQWVETCNRVLERFQEGLMGKIILARQTLLEFENGFAPLLFLFRYPYPESSTHRSYFEPEKNTAFFSFTPERLYRRNNNELLTEALAGTCSKETLGNGNVDACEQLLNSEKDIREHKFVKDTIARELEPICSQIDMEERVRALQLNRLVHLYTQCRATLNAESSSDNAVLKTLHPTPAVGGVPKTQALEQIIRLEPFSRGWYAGPVGWISRNSAEFAVGIRSAVAKGNKLYLYSGAGLVRGSDPASEWEEVDQKIADILAITRQKV
ncbi:MAG: isochorismate synthase [Chlorobiales bacterium]|nr:isochorismate synthase [Chlorobiales bacterium]